MELKLSETEEGGLKRLVKRSADGVSENERKRFCILRKGRRRKILASNKGAFRHCLRST